MGRKEMKMEKEKRSETFYRDALDLSPEDAERIDMLAASLGFGPKYKSEPRKTYECPKCKSPNAYYKEIHPDTDMNDVVLYCPDCKFEDE